MSRRSRPPARGRGGAVSARADRSAGLLAALALGGTALVLIVVLIIYSLTRPVELPQAKWPAFTATLVRTESGTPLTQQIWWRQTTWCARTVPADKVGEAWLTSYRRAELLLSHVSDTETAFEITEGGGAGPVDGFGPTRSDEARQLVKTLKAKVTGTTTIGGRKAYVVVQPEGKAPTDTGKTWWISTTDGLTLGYRERKGGHSYVDWRLTNVRTSKTPPWTAEQAASIDPLAAGPFKIVSVGSAGDQTGQSTRLVPPEQHPAFIDVAKRAYAVCKPGSSATVVEPTPTPAAAPAATPSP